MNVYLRIILTIVLAPIVRMIYNYFKNYFKNYPINKSNDILKEADFKIRLQSCRCNHLLEMKTFAFDHLKKIRKTGELSGTQQQTLVFYQEKFKEASEKYYNCAKIHDKKVEEYNKKVEEHNKKFHSGE